MEKFTWPIRVYYEDTDAGGVVYHSNYLNFLERARTEMLRAKGFEQNVLIAEQQIIFVVRSLEIQYLASARFNDLLQVTSTISLTRKASLTFEQSIHRAETLLCTAKICIACLDSQTMRPKIIPSELIAQFQ